MALEVAMILLVAGTVRAAVLVGNLPLVPHLLGHGRQSHALRQVGQRVDQSALLRLLVEEGAGVAKLAGTRLNPVLARDGLVVGVNSTECGLAEVLGQCLQWD